MQQAETILSLSCNNMPPAGGIEQEDNIQMRRSKSKQFSMIVLENIYYD